ncbi:hypothetical protein C8R46DRAFT_1305432 [Mycena filopes]|nr:hypothetical protein C8R46DRAFT_1305432 [Mycena filopes]
MATPSALDALPFVEDDPSADFLQHVIPPRRLDTINYEAVETWKKLCVPRLPSRLVHLAQGLSLFPTMQLDVVLEVLSYLHPLELSRVARTNKSFRQLLHSSISDALWRNSFRVDSDLPQCPAGVPGRRWSKLLFGPRICDECGQPDSPPNYVLLRRVCPTCLETNIVEFVPGYEEGHQINSVVRRTKAYMYEGADSDMDVEGGKFWRSEAAALVATYEDLSLSSESELLLSSFVLRQKASVELNRSRALRCEEWANNVRHAASSEYSDKLDRVVTSITKRLITEGFAEIDIRWYVIGECDALYRQPRLTSKSTYFCAVWNRVRPEILPAILTAHDERLAYEREMRFSRRKDAVLAVATLALCTPVPGAPHHAYYPPPHTIAAFPPLTAIFEDDSAGDEPIAEGDPRLLAALAQAPDFVQAWCAETRVESEAIVKHLDLTTSVFRVRRYDGRKDSVMGWRQARASLHWCHGAPVPATPEQKLVRFSARGSAVATALIRLLDLDPLTATGVDMDSADARFVVHDVDQADSHSTPSWVLLSPLAAADIQRREEPDDYSQLPVWTCTLCSQFSRRPSKQPHIVQHVRVVHEIPHPVEGMHMISFLGPQPPHRRRVPLREGAFPARYRCTHCAATSPQCVKLFPMRSIVPHLADKHQITAPSGGDWTEVEPILRSC